MRAAFETAGIGVGAFLITILGIGAAVTLATIMGVPVPIDWPDAIPNLLAPFLRQNGRLGPDGAPDDLCVWILSQGGCWPP